MVAKSARLGALLVIAGLLLSGCAQAPSDGGAPVPTFGVPIFDAAQAAAGEAGAVQTAVFGAEQNYTQAVTRVSETVSSALDLVTRATQLATNDTSLLLDADWRDAMVIGLATLKAAARELRDLQAPPRFADAQREFGYAATDLNGLADELAQWVDTGRGYNLTAALTRQRAANDALSRARQKLFIARAADYTPAPTGTPLPALLNLTPARVATAQP